MGDIERAADFYSAVLNQPGEQVSPGRYYFECGGAILACYDTQADGDRRGAGWRFHQNQYLYLAVENLEAAYERVQRAGGTIEAPIEIRPSAERLFYAYDPFGTPVSFVQNSTVFRGGAPAAGLMPLL